MRENNIWKSTEANRRQVREGHSENPGEETVNNEQQGDTNREDIKNGRYRGHGKKMTRS